MVLKGLLGEYLCVSVVRGQEAGVADLRRVQQGSPGGLRRTDPLSAPTERFGTTRRLFVNKAPTRSSEESSGTLKMAYAEPMDPIFTVLAAELIGDDPILEAAVAIAAVEEEREENR